MSGALQEVAVSPRTHKSGEEVAHSRAVGAQPAKVKSFQDNHQETSHAWDTASKLSLLIIFLCDLLTFL